MSYRAVPRYSRSWVPSKVKINTVEKVEKVNINTDNKNVNNYSENCFHESKRDLFQDKYNIRLVGSGNC